MTMRDIETKLLRSFLFVATEQSFSAAAELLNCSQGTMSLRIKSLERKVGKALFHRGRHRVELTGAGRNLLPAVRDFIEMHDRLKNRIFSGLPSGSARLGVTESLGMLLLAGLLKSARFPPASLELTVRCQLSRQLMQRIQAKTLDLAVVALPERDPSATVLACPQMRWVAAPDFAVDDRTPLPLAFYPSGCTFREAGIAALENAGIPYNISVCSSSGQAIWGSVDSGTTVSVLADGMIPTDWTVVRPSIGLPQLERTCIQLVEKGGQQSEAIELVKRAIASVFEGIYQREPDSEVVDTASSVM